MAAPKLRFPVTTFSDTPYDTAEEKAKAATALVRFIESGFKDTLFTKRVYDALYLHMYGHIAHYNRGGFYATWFGSKRDQLRWIEYAVGGGAYGFHRDPAQSWGDVERVIAAYLRNKELAGELADEIAADQESAEREELARLLEKYPEAVESRRQT